MRKTCTWDQLNPDESCDMPAVTRDLCRKHYDRARVEKLLQMVGTGPKGGRPTGPKLATPVAIDFESDPEPSVAELRSMAKKLMARIMRDPGAAQQERNLAMKLAVTMEDAEGSEEKKKAFQDMIAQARGLRAVDE